MEDKKPKTVKIETDVNTHTTTIKTDMTAIPVHIAETIINEVVLSELNKAADAFADNNFDEGFRTFIETEYQNAKDCLDKAMKLIKAYRLLCCACIIFIFYLVFFGCK